jgi:hypothetical protein
LERVGARDKEYECSKTKHPNNGSDLLQSKNYLSTQCRNGCSNNNQWNKNKHRRCEFSREDNLLRNASKPRLVEDKRGNNSTNKINQSGRPEYFG